MLSHNEIKKKLELMNLSEVARQIDDVSYATLYNLFNSDSLDGFEFKTVETISNFLERL